MKLSFTIVAAFLGGSVLFAQNASPRAASRSPAGGSGAWYVTPVGSDLNDCMTPGSPCATIGAAVGRAADGDTVYVALGTYTGQGTDVVLLDEDVMVSGGWEPDFSSRTGRSVIDGEAVRRALDVVSATSAQVEDFVLRNGASFGCVLVLEATLGLERCSIEDNSSNVGSVRVFRGALTLRDSTVRDNHSGPGIGAFDSDITLERCSVLDNAGQGIALGLGSADVSSSVLRGNGGPGIESDGSVVLRDCSIEGNSGGLLNFTGTMRVERSTIHGNSRFNFGGIQNLSGNGRIGSLTLINSTVSGNSTTFHGGGVFNSGALTANNCTITANSGGDGGGLYLNENPGFSSLDLHNTIVAGNSTSSFGAPDCGGGFTTSSGGYNLIGNTLGCPIDLVASDRANVDAHLGPLQDNGGPTLTHALLPDSPAIDHGNPAVPGSEPAACEPDDQRGVARPIGPTPDIGAFEALQFLVTNTLDSGAGSLRQAILAANATAGPDLIHFAIPGAGPHVINPPTDLPPLSAPVLIDGFSQPGSSPNTQPFGQGTDAVLRIVLDGFPRGAFSAGLIVTGAGSTIRGLVIQRFGVPVWLQADACVLEGNFIGTDVTGSFGASNGVGVQVDSSDNRIGGRAPRARNVISFNDGDGIRVNVGAKHNQIRGNFIGTNAAGTAALGNQFSGIELDGAGTEVFENLISANGRFAGPGITIFASDTVVAGNYIGTDVSGSHPLGNHHAGIAIGTGDGIRIGLDFGPGNLIAFNSDPFAQNGSGISILPGAGGQASVRIASNSIHSNGGLGIDLRPLGVNPNDVSDRDSGANDGQNFPVLSAAMASGFSLKLTGALEAHPAETYRIEFFRSSACDPSGHGEGETFLGFTHVVTDETGRAAIGIRIDEFDDRSRNAQEGWVTATATDLAGNTSEFSPCVAIVRRVHGDR